MVKQLLLLKESLEALLSKTTENENIRQSLETTLKLVNEKLKKKWVKVGPFKIIYPTEIEITSDNIKYYLLQIISILMNYGRDD